MTARASTILRVAFPAMILLLIGGCVRVTDDGNRQVLDYELWVPFTVLLACLAVLPAGWFLQRASQRFGLGLMVVGLALLVILVPTLFRDKVTIDDQRVSTRTGLWFFGSAESVDFDNINRVVIAVVQSTDSKGRQQTGRCVVCEKKTGPAVRLSLGGMFDAALPYILKAAEKHGVRISDER